MSSSSIVFIALQCCQCSTMQVKQKKKSSNKWTCAVCNQKQSVRKVFAQGYLASDIRKFVQTFNMSRKSLDENAQWTVAETLAPPPEHDFATSQKKKRTDWAAYLDRDDDHAAGKRGEQQQNGDDFEPLVVTELPKSMSKKRRLVENSTAGGDRLFERPRLSNNQVSGHIDAEEPMKDKRRIELLTESNAEKINKVTRDTQRTQKCKPAITKSTSKWNDYLAEDNVNDCLEFGWKGGFKFKDHSGLCNTSNNVLEAMTGEQRVEDDIHPDFM